MNKKTLIKIIQQAYNHQQACDVLHTGEVIFGYVADRSLVAYRCEALDHDKKAPSQAHIKQVLEEKEMEKGANRHLEVDEVEHNLWSEI